MSSQKEETKYIAKVHKHLSNVYFEKTNNPFRRGMPDVWYSGPKGDLWIEYKIIETIPTNNHLLPALSELQLRWLKNRWLEGRNVAVIVGVGKSTDRSNTHGIVFVDRLWETEFSDAYYRNALTPNLEIARWITSITGGGVKE